MENRSLFSEIINLYPKKIVFHGIQIFENGAARIPELIKAHDLIFEICIYKGQNHAAMDWAIFQALHKVAIGIYKENGTELILSKINYENVNQLYLENMQAIKAARNANIT